MKLKMNPNFFILFLLFCSFTSCVSPDENPIPKPKSYFRIEFPKKEYIQINNDYYEDLDEKSTVEILNSLISDKPLKPGSYRGRKNTSPEINQSQIRGKHA